MPKVGMTQLAPATLRNQFFYQHFDRQYFRKVLSVDPQNLIGYWPMWEASGSVADDLSSQGNDGAYTGVTLKQPGIGDGRSCPLFDGANDYNNIYSTGLVADFNGAEGTLALWIKAANAAVWEDGTVRRIVILEADTNNNVLFTRQAANNKVRVRYKASGTTKDRDKTVSDTDWMFWAMTWSKAADQVKVYYNGVQEGATLTGLGTWVGNLKSTATVIGAANTTPANVWNGHIVHVQLRKAPLGAQQILRLNKP